MALRRSRNNKNDTYVAINAPLSGASVASDLAAALHGMFPGYLMRGRYESRKRHMPGDLQQTRLQYGATLSQLGRPDGAAARVVQLQPNCSAPMPLLMAFRLGAAKRKPFALAETYRV